ncbi:unnamed protein product [Urochloa humidicola]
MRRRMESPPPRDGDGRQAAARGAIGHPSPPLPPADATRRQRMESRPVTAMGGKPRREEPPLAPHLPSLRRAATADARAGACCSGGGAGSSPALADCTARKQLAVTLQHMCYFQLEDALDVEPSSPKESCSVSNKKHFLDICKLLPQMAFVIFHELFLFH